MMEEGESGVTEQEAKLRLENWFSHTTLIPLLLQSRVLTTFHRQNLSSAQEC